MHTVIQSLQRACQLLPCVLQHGREILHDYEVYMRCITSTASHANIALQAKHHVQSVACAALRAKSYMQSVACETVYAKLCKQNIACKASHEKRYMRALIKRCMK